MQNKSRVVAVAGGHVALIVAFAVFVVVNGAIVVGDGEAHQATLHLAQLPYFSLFAAAAFAPSWLHSSMCVVGLLVLPYPLQRAQSLNLVANLFNL